MGRIKVFHKVVSCNTEVPSMDREPGEEGLSDEEVALVRTLQHWVLWNTFLESITDFRINTEGINGSVIHEVYRRTSVNPPDGSPRAVPYGKIKSKEEIDEILAGANSNKNHDHTRHPPEDLTWDLLMGLNGNYTMMAQMMAQRYGYDVDVTAVPVGAQQICGIRKVDSVWTCRLSRP